MRTYELRRTHTAKREEWLRLLAEHGPHSRCRGVVGFQCMRLGWTDWLRPHPEDGPSLEQITDEGRAVLREWGAGP